MDNLWVIALASATFKSKVKEEILLQKFIELARSAHSEKQYDSGKECRLKKVLPFLFPVVSNDTYPCRYRRKIAVKGTRSAQLFS